MGKKKIAIKKDSIKTVGQKSNNVELADESKNSVIQIPARLLAPIGTFLSNQLQSLEKQRSRINNEDPFLTGREESQASPDANASEQFGHARTEAFRNQIDKRIIQVRKALSRVRVGNYGICERCKKMIDTDRLMVYPEATLCISCEKKKEKK